MKNIGLFILIVVLFNPSLQLNAKGTPGSRLQPYIDILQQEGREPSPFVIKKLDSYDLLIFDDAWHPVVEPFEFYQRLIENPSFHNKVKYIFLEVIPLNKQHCLDDYLNSKPEDKTLLYPAFQDDFSGLGWAFQTYFDLLHTIYAVNQKLPDTEKIKVVAVNAPVYWSEIKTSKDVALFRQSLIGNDYTMYKIILSEMENFAAGKKGIFLTNTRHAYKGIRDKSGKYFWNAGTFLHQWHPGKTYSIRFHHLALSIRAEKSTDGAPKTTAGMERYDYSWIRMADGLWDSAFEALGNKPIAFPLNNNVFGNEAYVGNHMHKAAPNQTMSDANDAIIFLAPLEKLHNTATVDFIYTDAFKKELERRYQLLYTESQIQEKMEEYGAENPAQLIEKTFVKEEQKLIPQAQNLPSGDTWKTSAKAKKTSK